ncbi:MAG: hypothetical protein JRI25_01005 [Deltaproteobacteria bacterium]|nr:hypothetical protein [Deltaproteobacteria bacterium]
MTAEILDPRTRRLRMLPIPATFRLLARNPDDGWVLAEPWPMGEGTRRAFHGLMRAMLPPPPAPEVPLERMELQIRCLLRYFHPLIARGFALGVRLLDWSPVWRFRSFKRVQKLPREEGCALLERLAHSRNGPLAQLAVAVRSSVLSAYFDQDEVIEALGYTPVPFITERTARRDQIVAEEQGTPEEGP